MIKYLIPAVMMFVLVAAVQTLTPQPQVAAVPLITEVVQAEATGPGFFPAPKDDSKGCQCGDFAALEKRVADLEAKIASYGTARPVASNGSAGQSGGVAVSRPTTTSGLPYGSVVISERVVSSSPTVTQSGPVLPNYNWPTSSKRCSGRSYWCANTTCRIVNGVRVCN
jgi:hypothetical protein